MTASCGRYIEIVLFECIVFSYARLDIIVHLFCRLAVTEENIALLHSLVSPLPPTPLLPSHLDLLTNCFKLMRNLSAGVSENQKRIV